MDTDPKRRSIDFATMNARTPARLGVGHAGPRYRTESMLKLRADHARAVDAVANEVAPGWPKRHRLIELRSCAPSHDIYLDKPGLGRRLTTQSLTKLRKIVAADRKSARRGRTAKAKPSLMICIADGLSSAAVERNAINLMRALRLLVTPKYRLLPMFFIRYGRVRIQDQIGAIAGADVVCLLIGERPGLATAESLSAYVIYKPRLKSLEPDRTVISNIHRDGLSLPEAAAKITRLIDDRVANRASGSKLAKAIESAPANPAAQRT
ncbi:MAG TPA: ethanolamine ammonia-lyase subunit EutC [Candidatus Binataceae bacterium]